MLYIASSETRHILDYFLQYEDQCPYAIEFWDDNWAYWKTSYASSPAIRIRMKWSEERQDYVYHTFKSSDYNSHIDIDSLTSEIIDLKYWCDLTDDMDAHNIGGLYQYWSYIIDLLTHSQNEEAIRFSNLAWNGPDEYRVKFLMEFRVQFESSDHIEFIRLLNPDLDSFWENL
jgi:hypothetical protein